MSVNEPLYNFARAFADQGTKNIIPDNNNEASGLASLINGFPAITQVKPEMGGIPPQRADFNGILYMLSAFCLWAQSGGQYTYKNNLQYNINCMVLHNNVFLRLSQGERARHDSGQKRAGHGRRDVANPARIHRFADDGRSAGRYRYVNRRDTQTEAGQHGSLFNCRQQRRSRYRWVCNFYKL